MEYVGEKVDLRDFGRIGLFTVSEHWKAAKHTKQQEELFALLKSKLDDPDEQTQLQAAHFLYMLDDSRTEPAIAKVRKVSEQRRLVTARTVSVNTAWIAGPFPDGDDGLKKTHTPEQGAIDLSAKYNVDGTELTWKQMKKGGRMFDFLKQFGPCDRSSYYAYCRLESPRKQQVMLLVGSDDGVKIWNNGQIVWTNSISRAALPYQDVVFVDLQPGSNDLLVRLQNNSGECALYLHFRTLGEVAVTLPEKLGIASLAERLKTASGASGTTKLGKEFLDVDWSAASRSGDSERGRKLFSADGIGCVKCHAIRPEMAVQGGPSLVGAGKRFTVSYLVESILLPSKHVSPVFQSTLIVTTNGKSYTGLVLNETAEKIEIMLPDAKRQTIPKDDIEVRKIQKISPMPHGVVKNPDELRDLLTYLLRN